MIPQDNTEFTWERLLFVCGRECCMRHICSNTCVACLIFYFNINNLINLLQYLRCLGPKGEAYAELLQNALGNTKIIVINLV